MFVFTECELLAQYEMVGVTELFFFFLFFLSRESHEEQYSCAPVINAAFQIFHTDVSR